MPMFRMFKNGSVSGLARFRKPRHSTLDMLYSLYNMSRVDLILSRSNAEKFQKIPINRGIDKGFPA